MELVNHTVINLIIFVLAIYVGYHVEMFKKKEPKAKGGHNEGAKQ